VISLSNGAAAVNYPGNLCVNCMEAVAANPTTSPIDKQYACYQYCQDPALVADGEISLFFGRLICFSRQSRGVV
jgi:hypothetical protein